MSNITGERLKAARKYASITTQKWMAQILHVPLHTYSAWENGYAEPPLYIIREFCSRFSISADYLLGLSENKVIIDEAEHLQYSVLSELSEKYQQEALNYIEYLKEKDRREADSDIG